MRAEEIGKALGDFMLSATKAESTYDFEEAINYYHEAQSVISENNSLDLNLDSFEISSALINIFSIQGKRKAAKEEIKKISRLVENEFNDNDEILIKVKMLIAENSILISDFDLARDVGKVALRLAKKIKDKRLIARAYMILGEAYTYLGVSHDIAIKYLEPSLSFYQAENNLPKIAKNNQLIALLYLKHKNFAEAELFAGQALEMYQKIGDKIGENRVLRYLGDIFCADGEYIKGLKIYKQVYQIRQEIGQTARVGGALGDIGDVYLALGFYDRSLDLHRRSLAINKEVGDKYGQIGCHHDIGLIYYNLAQNAENKDNYLNKIRQSCSEIKNAIEIAKNIKEKDLLAMCQNTLALSYIDLAHSLDEKIYFWKAIKLTEESIETSQKASFTSHKLVGDSYQALAYFHIGEMETALSKSNEVINFLKRQSNTFALSEEEIYFIHSLILAGNNMSHLSTTYLKKAKQKVEQKADKIKIKRLRESFLKVVPINRKIIEMQNGQMFGLIR